MKLILLGAPGAGKGTQGAIIRDKLNIPIISTGDMIRSAIRNQTEVGKKAKAFVDDGKLVPDDVVVAIVKERLSQQDCANGYILDGFPRTIAQAEALDRMGVVIDKVIDLQVADEVIIGRLSGRRVCTDCGATYHVTNIPPQKEGICDKCGKELSIRKDDVPETIGNRLEVYHEQTAPLQSYYTQKGILTAIKGDDPLEVASANILKALGA
jgi:adenylate kinases